MEEQVKDTFFVLARTAEFARVIFIDSDPEGFGETIPQVLDSKWFEPDLQVFKITVSELHTKEIEDAKLAFCKALEERNASKETHS